MTSDNRMGPALLNVFLSPAAAFGALRGHVAWAWPALVVLVICHAIGVYLWMGPMSPEWIVDQQLAIANLPATQAADARGILIQLAPHAAHLAVITGASTTVGVAVLLGALLLLAERVLSRSRNSFGAWFSAAAWSMLPLALNSLGLAVLSLMASTPNQPLSLANYASLNNLVLHLPIGHSHYVWAEAINLFYLWTALLAATALRVWTGMAWVKAVLAAFLPYIVLFGLWGAVS